MITQKLPPKKHRVQNIIIDIDGPQGNAYCLLGMALHLCDELNWNEKSKNIQDEMTSGDYINLVKTFDKYFGDFVILKTKNHIKYFGPSIFFQNNVYN